MPPSRFPLAVHPWIRYPRSMRILLTGATSKLGKAVVGGLRLINQPNDFLRLDEEALRQNDLAKRIADFAPTCVVHLAGLEMPAEAAFPELFERTFLQTIALLDAVEPLARKGRKLSFYLGSLESVCVPQAVETAIPQPQEGKSFVHFLCEEALRKRTSEVPQLTAVVLRLGSEGAKTLPKALSALRTATLPSRFEVFNVPGTKLAPFL